MSKGNMEMRKSTREDIEQIMAIFTTAKEYMAAHEIKHNGEMDTLARRY
mgnify:FL=1